MSNCTAMKLLGSTNYRMRNFLGKKLTGLPVNQPVNQLVEILTGKKNRVPIPIEQIWFHHREARARFSGSRLVSKPDMDFWWRPRAVKVGKFPIFKSARKQSEKHPIWLIRGRWVRIWWSQVRISPTSNFFFRKFFFAWKFLLISETKK